FDLFNRGFQATANGYARLVGVLLRTFVRVLLVYGGMLAVTYYGHAGFPRGMLSEKFVQELDKDVESGQGTKYPSWLKAVVQFPGLPRGFIPSQDMGYLLVNIQLPDSAALERTEAVLTRVAEVAHATPGIDATVAIAGQSILLTAYGSNFGTMFITLKG